MKKRSITSKILLGILALLVIIQLFRIDKKQPAVNRPDDFIAMTNAPAEVASLLKTACYDCHSDESVFPWYSNIAPVSWWLKHHIDEGRYHLNFSTWGTYAGKKKDHKLEECVEMTEEKEMPLDSYTWIHKDAKLSDQQRKLLTDWFNSQRTFESAKK